MKNLSFGRRLRFAFAGLRHAARSERSFKTQLAGAAFALGSLLWLRPPATWWVLVGICATGVLSCELLNTALEAWLDEAHPGPSEGVRVAKDCAAAAVLLWSCLSVATYAALVITQLS